MLTTPDNIWTPDQGDDFALTTDLAATAESIQLALNRRANAYTGTTSQRVAAQDLPVGSTWTDTDGSFGTWVMRGSGWGPAPGSIITVASRAEADAVVDGLKTGGIDLSTHPLFVLRRDTWQTEMHNGTAWVPVGGPDGAGKSKKATLQSGWTGNVHYSQSNGMCTVSFGVTRTGGTFSLAAWGAAYIASGLPKNIQPTPLNSFHLYLGSAMTNATDPGIAHYTAGVDANGILNLHGLWSTRNFTHTSWWSGSFSYPTG